MTLQSPVGGLTFRARGDLSAKQYHIMRYVPNSAMASGLTDLASATSAQTDIFGVLQNKCGSGQAANVGMFGEAKVVAGAAFGGGVALTSNTSGRAVTASSGDYVVGISVDAAAADGDLARLILRLPAVRQTF